MNRLRVSGLTTEVVLLRELLCFLGIFVIGWGQARKEKGEQKRGGGSEIWIRIAGASKRERGEDGKGRVSFHVNYSVASISRVCELG